MKENITKAEFINTWASEWDEKTGWKVSEIYHQQFSEQLESIINQEVEKRIAERMPSEEEIGNSVLDYCANPTEDGGVDFDQKQGYSFQCGIEWLRFRLTCSEKPNNSQKTEGGEG